MADRGSRGAAVAAVTTRRRVLVFGASGHTGRHVVAELVARNVEPVLVARDPARLATDLPVRRADGTKDARLFTGPRGGRITTAVLRDATGWDEAVTKLGHEHLRRHDLRHTALTWFADAGVLPHQLQKIAGHGSLATTQRYLHPDRQSITAAGVLLSRHLGTSARRPATPTPRPAKQVIWRGTDAACLSTPQLAFGANLRRMRSGERRMSEGRRRPVGQQEQRGQKVVGAQKGQRLTGSSITPRKPTAPPPPAAPKKSGT